MLLLYLLLYQAKELGTAVPEGHVAGLGGYVNYRGEHRYCCGYGHGWVPTVYSA